MTGELVTAIELAQAAKINAKTFRQALRDQNFAWHKHGMRWTVEHGSIEHAEMLVVLSRLSR